MRRLPILLAALAALLPPRPLPAQGGAGWNSTPALEAIRRAQERRSAAVVDTGLVNYRSDARLYVYFYLDRPGNEQRNLVKTDQLALEVLWQAPDRVKQRILGWRDEESLPTLNNINYHLDHLTVVLENFGDEIRLGDGDEVRGVPHPAAPGAEGFYDYRLSDSLTLTLPGTPEPVRVQKVDVRPKDASLPAFVGSLFVDRRAGDIVRMDFTFTRSSYVDEWLDHINISLDNGLWRGRFWLPNEQRVEIRRRVPLFDIPVGSVIRATMRVGNYRFNQPFPPNTFAGPTVVTVPREQREAFPFEEELHAEVREEGIGPAVELAEIRREAAALIREQMLRRAGAAALRLPAFSDVVRYNRAEGAVLSGTVGLSPAAVPVRLGVQAGYAFGAGHAVGEVELTGRDSRELAARLYVNRPVDLAPGPVVSGALNTLSAFLAGEDYLDLYHATGGELALERGLSPQWSLLGSLRAEQQESPEPGVDFSLFGRDFRPLQALDRVELHMGATLALRRPALAEMGRWWSAWLALEGAVVNPVETDDCDLDECTPQFQGQYLRPRAELGWGRRWDGERETELAARLQAGSALGSLPAQALYRLGGRGTVPGYGFRDYAGAHFAAADATLSATLLDPWLRGRLSAALGWTETFGVDTSELGAAALRGTGTLKPSLGVGVGILHDILRVDLARGLARGGSWELIVEANPEWWGLL